MVGNIGLKSYISVHGISHYTTAPHTPQQNGMSERQHRHLVETGLTLLMDAHMSLSYWPYAFQTVAYLINRMPTSTLNNQSPFEKLFKQMPNYLKLKQFGCLCYPLTRPYNKHKLEPKAQPCTFVGYSLSQNAYLCFDPTTQKFFISRDVIFHKGTFPFSNPKNTNSPSSTAEDPCITISLSQHSSWFHAALLNLRTWVLKSRHRLRMGHPLHRILSR